MDDTFEVGPRLVYSRMECVTGFVDAQSCTTTIKYVTLHVQFNKAGRGHLMIQNSKRVDEEVFMVLTDSSLLKKHNKL